jgi:hypothetical protein
MVSALGMVTVMGRGRKNNSHKCDQVRVITLWRPIRTVTPGFKRLMDIILKPRPESKHKEGSEERGED